MFPQLLGELRFWRQWGYFHHILEESGNSPYWADGGLVDNALDHLTRYVLISRKKYANEMPAVSENGYM